MSGEEAVRNVLLAGNEARAAGSLPMWTIYDHPTDFPELFVARMFVVRGDGGAATEETILHHDIEHIRQILHRAGLVALPRSEVDDPKIVETWI